MHDGRAPGLGRRAGLWLSLVSVVSILGWAVPALLMLGRGFAVEDEGTYVLTYRFWHSNPYFFSGAQYFYGPIFQALGESIPLMRLLRLLMVLGANVWFATCFLRWLRGQTGANLPVRRLPLVLVLTASGGMAYLWSPLTPGYYDLTAAASLVTVSLLLRTLATPHRPPPWIPLVSGAAAALLVVTRWPAFSLPALTVAVSVWWRRRESWSEAARFVAWVVAGFAGIGALAQVFLVPVGRLASDLAKVSALSAVANHGLGFLIHTALRSTGLLAVATVAAALPLVFGLVGARVSARRGNAETVWWWVLGACGFTLVVVPLAGGWRGGGAHGGAVIGIVFGSLAVALGVAVVLPSGRVPGGASGVVLATVLVLAPALQSAGSNVPLLYLAAECLSMWVALVLLFLARMDCPPFAQRTVLAYLGVLVLATGMIAGSTTLVSPFKTDAWNRDQVLVPQLGLMLDHQTAREYAALTTTLRPYVIRGETPMITLDQLGGLTYLLGAVPAGSTYTSASTPGATAAVLELACRNGDVPPDRKPVLILDRSVDTELQHAMDVCGFGFPDDYRELDVPNGPPGLRVLVPRSPS